MKRCVCYLVSGPAHLPYLAVSLYTLRRFWSGMVHVYAWPESYEIASRIAADPLICAFCSDIKPEQRCRLIGGQPFDRIRIMQDGSTKQTGLYLDCDTIVDGDVQPLLLHAEAFGFVFTQFCKWTTAGSKIRSRISRLVGIEGIPQDAVQRIMEWPMPSVNTGIFACRADSPVLDEWHGYIELAKHLFIGDEISAHAVASKYIDPEQAKTINCPAGILVVSGGDVSIAGGGVWNCSPKFQPAGLWDYRVRIWHGHGDCFTRPDKSPKGVDLWWPLLGEVFERNVGGIQEWLGMIQHKYLQQMLTKGMG
jgi:hypothetical protein